MRATLTGLRPDGAFVSDVASGNVGLEAATASRFIRMSPRSSAFGMLITDPSLELSSRSTRITVVKIENDSISLRPATMDDQAFLLELYRSSRGDDLRGLGWDEDRIAEFLAMQYEAQQKFHNSDYQNASDEIILCDIEPAGRLLVDSREHEIRCVDIALLPDFRNRGIGSLMISQLQTRAGREQKPLRLQVIRFSRAINLFERLGFERTSETGTHFQMEWVPR